MIAASAQILFAVIEELSSAEVAVPAEDRTPMLAGR